MRISDWSSDVCSSDLALQQDIRQINVESLPELEALSEVAGGLGRRAEIAIRVNPDVDARTHAKITTGRQDNKLRIDIADARATYARPGALAGVRPEDGKAA